jgi:N-acetyl-anhydromuramyl-L-alanine amidase AmpD
MPYATVPQPKWTELVTKNFSNRKLPVRWIVLHHTAGREAGDLSTLLGQTKRRVSADFYVTRKGKVYKLNPQLGNYYTWHAGISYHKGVVNLNRVTVGIEQEHIPGENWPQLQVAATAHICAWLIERYNLKLEDGPILSHRIISFPRKTDPEGFPWKEFGRMVRETLSV